MRDIFNTAYKLSEHYHLRQEQVHHKNVRGSLMRTVQTSFISNPTEWNIRTLRPKTSFWALKDGLLTICCDEVVGFISRNIESGVKRTLLKILRITDQPRDLQKSAVTSVPFSIVALFPPRTHRSRKH